MRFNCLDSSLLKFDTINSFQFYIDIISHLGGSYSFASDIWSLGLSIHTVAIGKYPYNIEKKGFWNFLSAVQEVSYGTYSILWNYTVLFTVL